jgi:hypothetical protein
VSYRKLTCSFVNAPVTTSPTYGPTGTHPPAIPAAHDNTVYVAIPCVFVGLIAVALGMTYCGTYNLYLSKRIHLYIYS